jgi:hypothetical protein
MRTQRLREIAFIGSFAAACTACATTGSPGDGDDGTDGVDPSGEVPTLGQIGVTLPAGTLQAAVVELATAGGLLDAVNHHNNVYIHVQSDGTWYFKSGNYLLGIEAFTQYHQQFDAKVVFGTGDKVAPAQARVVGQSPHGVGWEIPSLDSGGQWPATANSVWVIGTNGGTFGMGGAPQSIPFGTEVFGSTQAYGGALSTPYLEFDSSPGHDSTRIRARFGVRADTLLGGHSAGASAARRIALDIGMSDVWLYGTPNYTRGNGAYSKTETSSSHHTMVAEVINNPDDPVTNVLAFPFSLITLAWGTAKCHDYSHWDYEETSPVDLVCQ